jgi:hypothetical protein
MPVFFISAHSYRSWSVDRRHVRRGKAGIFEPDPQLAHYRDSLASLPPVAFSASQMQLLVGGTREICSTHGWRLHGVAVVPTHVHALISWQNDTEESEVSKKLKQLLGMRLSRNAGSRGNRWFSRGCDRKRVRDRDHFA